MLDTEETAPQQANTLGRETGAPTASVRERNKRLRGWAAGLGLIGTLLALAVPFLPVTYDQVDLRWPTVQGTRAVSAPLTGYQPTSVAATVPCAAARNLGSGVIFATVPPASVYAGSTGMVITVHNGQFGVVDNGKQLASAAMPHGDSCALTVHSTGLETTVALDGTSLAVVRSDIRPQVTGIYSDLVAGKDDVRGLSVDIQPDTRYQTTATALKIAAMVLAVLALLGAAIAVHKLDLRATGHRLRLAPTRWWRPTVLDLSVLAVLIVWWLIGAGTSDDGYILVMARDEAESGYIGNIFRWFNTPEAPFGWFYELYARWVRISTLTPWTRLPALLLGIASWLLISREAIPRLGRAVRRSRAATWAAAGAFLVFWLPYDNGLRPESVVVLWTLLSMVLVERAIAAKRLLPAAAALFAAAFAVAATPSGLMALAPLLAAAPPLVSLLRDRGRQFGWLATLAPLTAAGTIVLLAVFGNQTMRSVLDSTQVRTAIGPAESWYQERDRYEFLFSMAADGSLERRFPVLLIGLCLFTCLIVLLRKGKIPGAAVGPSKRLIGTTILSFGVLVLTPTKWTHHFGAFAALGGSVAALAGLATSTSVLRSRRNRALFTAGLLLITAVAFTGPNAWFYSANWGSPWTNMAPVIHGHLVGSLLLGLAVLALLVAGVEHLRGPQPPKLVTQRRRLRFAFAPVALLCAVLVVAEVANFGKVISKQGPAYSLGKDNIAQLTSSSCGVSDYTYVETNPLGDVLRPAGSATLNGFRPNGFPQDSTYNPAQRIWLPVYGTGPDAVPAWGNSGATASSQLRTAWYPLPARAHAANALLAVDVAGRLGNGNSVVAEFGRQTASGFQVTADEPLSQSAGSPNWREAKLALTGQAGQSDAVRLIATAGGAAGTDNWIGVTAPRVPTLVGMTALVGNSPTFIEWPSAQGYPCLRPFGTSDGISELPAYWYSAGEDIRIAGQQWSGAAFGGPLGWMDVTQGARVLPTYLKDDLQRDAGTLYRMIPDAPDALPASAAMQVTHVTHWGMYSPGPNSRPITAPSVTPSANGLGSAPIGP